MDIEFLITDKRLYKMRQEVFASSELHSSFPRYKTSKDFSNGDNIVIPNLILPLSKYSSTDTELSSLEENGDALCGVDCIKLTPSEFSASSTASGRKRRRRRKRKLNGRSSSTLSLNSNESNASYESRAGGLSFLSLNAVRDLEHAIGRHRGVSGSSVPSMDAAIFGMFYMTDVFDSFVLTEPHFSREGTSSILGGNIRALLKKEIVYSLRVNYYCPVNKMVKLAQLLEEHSPVDKIKSDIPRFLKILWDVLKLPPFLKYTNGSNGYMLPLLLEPKRINEPTNYQHQQVHTLQYLLNCEFSSELSSTGVGGGPGKLFWGGRAKFLTVPYPALIIEVIRTEDVTLSSRSNNQEPVIPNLELDISAFISSSTLHVPDSHSSLHRSNSSITNCSFMSSASFNSERSFLYEYERADQISKESRLVKGLKSAWKVMFQYLEDFTSSTHISPDSIIDGSAATTRNDDDFVQQRTEGADWNTNYHQPWYISPPPSQEGRASRSSSISSTRKSPYRSLTTTRTPTPTPQTQVRMELIAVICMTNGKEARGDNYLSVNNRRKFSGYSVYCKAGRDGSNNSKEFAPWVLYQPQRGVAPQVTLIENCGKWISSLESQAENLALYNIPLEIRRMVTESSLFIYRKIDP